VLEGNGGRQHADNFGFDRKFPQIYKWYAELFRQRLLNLIFLDDTPTDENLTQSAFALFLLFF
jgi:hypothetical protein